MMGFLMFLHILIAIFLVTIILMQSGRGGGLTEGFASAESMFGASTNEFLIRGTTILATCFLLTSLALAFLSARKEKSIIPEDVPAVTLPAATPPSPGDTSQPQGAEKSASLPATP